MGNWNINIQGVGCHHNANNPGDADILALEFVKKLKAEGHIINHAVITFGSANDLDALNMQNPLAPHKNFTTNA